MKIITGREYVRDEQSKFKRNAYAFKKISEEREKEKKKRTNVNH